MRDLDRLLDRATSDGGDEQTAPFGLHLALVVQRGGRVVAERYGESAGPDTPLVSWSMAKSVTHAMVGLLVERGLLDPEAPADVPRWADDDRSAITLRQLLEMNSGLEFVEDYVDDQVSHVIEMLFGAGKDDVAAYAESFPLIHSPGDVFNYSSGTTNIISAICGRAIARHGLAPSAIDFVSDALFAPTGMTSATATADPAGTFIGSSFVHATARDFARFGELYRNDGVTEQGERILPAGWADDARRPVTSPVEDGHWYGSHWWLWDHRYRPSPTAGDVDCTGIDGYGAHGYEGQYTVVVPDRDLVVVRLGKTPVERQPEVRSWLADIIRCFPVSSPS